MLLDEIEQLNSSFVIDIKSVNDSSTLDAVRIKYLSKSGLVTALYEKLKAIPKDEKPTLGKHINSLRDLITGKLNELKTEFEKNEQGDKINPDLSLPGKKIAIGSKHILTQTMDEIQNIFKGLGFSVVEGPELESDYYNFESLNFPPDHPARDMQDTYFVGNKFVMRTHTTPVQVRIMEKTQPPVRAIMPGKVFRNEAVSARSYCTFHQVDGIYVDTNVTFAELKGTLVSFAHQFYGENLPYRFRPSYFPFTEPSAEMDIHCFNCNGKGCKLCKGTGWLEILGCGMVDPNVFKYVNYDSEKYSGYAFGMGIERIAMMKYGIDDIRIIYENDIRFLKQF